MSTATDNIVLETAARILQSAKDANAADAAITEGNSKSDLQEMSRLVLSQQDLVPSPIEHAAILAARGLKYNGQLIGDLQRQHFNEDLQKLVAEFFELEPTERLAQWSSLMNRTQFNPTSLRRVNQLQPGINASIPVLTNPVEKQIAADITTLFLVSGTVRANRRRKAVRLLIDQFGVEEVKARMKSLNERFPDFCKLAPVYRARLVHFRKPKRSIAASSYYRPSKDSAFNNIRDVNPSTDRRQQQRQFSEAKSGSFPYWILAVIGITVIRGLMAFNTGSTSQQPVYRPPSSYQFDQQQWRDQQRQAMQQAYTPGSEQWHSPSELSTDFSDPSSLLDYIESQEHQRPGLPSHSQDPMNVPDIKEGYHRQKRPTQPFGLKGLSEGIKGGALDADAPFPGLEPIDSGFIQ